MNTWLFVRSTEDIFEEWKCYIKKNLTVIYALDEYLLSSEYWLIVFFLMWDYKSNMHLRGYNFLDMSYDYKSHRCIS